MLEELPKTIRRIWLESIGINTDGLRQIFPLYDKKSSKQFIGMF